MNELYPLPNDFDAEKYPNTAKYIMLYGIHECMSEWDLVSPYKSCEEVYKVCLEKETTWKELLNFKGYDKNTLL